ncbi:MAG TPA: T9SS type A sorting domain-containing protein [Flavobacteriales bacterium]
MRTPLLTAFLLPAWLQAQPDYLTGTPVWTVTQVCNQAGFGGGPCITTDVLNYTLAGDSIIDGLTYTKVERTGTVDPMWTGVEPTPPSCINTYTYGPWHAGLIRQEGRTLRKWDGENDVLLYDFDLQIGQNVPLSAVNGNDQITVSALDSIEMNGVWRRVYTITGDWSATLIEGVGSDKGLFEPMSTMFECGYQLDCFSLEGQSYYPTPGPDCDLHIGLAETQQPRLMLAPNPTEGLLQVITPDRTASQATEVVDVNGRTVQQATLQGGRAEIDLTGVPAGTYMIRVGPYRERVVLLGR